MLVEQYNGYEIVEDGEEFLVRAYLTEQRTYITLYRALSLEDAKSFIDTL